MLRAGQAQDRLGRKKMGTEGRKQRRENRRGREGNSGEKVDKSRDI